MVALPCWTFELSPLNGACALHNSDTFTDILIILGIQVYQAKAVCRV